MMLFSLIFFTHFCLVVGGLALILVWLGFVHASLTANRIDVSVSLRVIVYSCAYTEHCFLFFSMLCLCIYIHIYEWVWVCVCIWMCFCIYYQENFCEMRCDCMHTTYNIFAVVIHRSNPNIQPKILQFICFLSVWMTEIIPLFAFKLYIHIHKIRVFNDKR